MSADATPELLFALVTLRLGFASEQAVADVVPELRHAPDRDLGALLLKRGVLKDFQAAAVRVAAAASLRLHGDARHAVEALGVPRLIHDAWTAPSTSPSTAVTLVMSDSRIVAARKASTIPLPPPDPAGHGKPMILTQPPEGKYALGGELGRGGIGRVVEARDTDIGRSVALKLMLEDAPPDAMERFRWEGQITGRLEHPNIVPVHDFGILPATREIYVCMKKISGRDMQQVIREGKWKLRRLVEAFRDVCRAVAYAHSKGVVHRDLKPANVMLGDFGEVLLVDWGLAKIVSGPEAPLAPEPPGAEVKDGTTRIAPQRGSKASHLTLDGQVVGTPSYMPPEQARGKSSDIDERSDVYSLGAILYEILTGHAPFEDPNPWEVVRMVRKTPPKPPSQWCDVPPELEVICLRALQKKKDDRYRSAAELASEIDAYLEGTKERERRETLAREQVEKAKKEMETWRRQESEAKEAMARARAMNEEIKAHDTLLKKKELWEVQDRAKALERQALRAFGEADAALTSALSNVPDLAEARRLKAEMAWAKFVEAEESGDERSALLFRQTVERHDDGAFGARLRGDGTLAVRTRAFGCACFSEGRRVAPDEMNLLGYHPWSGRLLAIEGSGGLRDLEPAEPVRLKVHGRACQPHPVEGAQVWAFRYVEMDRALVPVTVGAGKPKVPEAAVASLFGDSPYRPRGTGMYLGTTPVPRRAWPMGSWLLVVVAEGHEPLAVPISVGRQQDLELDVTLLPSGSLPAGFLPVPGGSYLYGVERPSASAVGAGLRHLDDFLIARHPVTCREYAAFLNDLLRTSPDEAIHRAPRQGEASPPYWPLIGEKEFVVPTAEWLAKAPKTERVFALRLQGVERDWEESWPILSVTWEDAAAYARWASARSGRLLALPHEDQWEKAARGPDGRPQPWGHGFDPVRANCTESHADGLRPVPVEAFPMDESPYGVRGMGGNSRDWCLNDPGGRRYRDWRCARGGVWNASQVAAVPARRFAFAPRQLDAGFGFRLSAVVRL